MAAELKLKFEVADNFKKKIQDSFKGVFNMSGKGGKAPEPNFKYVGKPMVELNNKIKTFAKSMSLNNSSLNKLNSQISNLQKIQSKITPGMPGSTGRMSKLNELIERNQGKILKLTDKNNKINLKQSAAIDAMLSIEGKNPIGEQTINTLSQQIKVLEDIRDNLSDIEEINKLNNTIGEKQEKLGELTGIGAKGKSAKGGIGLVGAAAMGGIAALMIKLVQSTKAIQFVMEMIGGMLNLLIGPLIPILLTLLKPFLMIFLFLSQFLFAFFKDPVAALSGLFTDVIEAIKNITGVGGKDKQNEAVAGAGTILGGVIGASLGGPIGAAIGVTVGAKILDFFIDLFTKFLFIISGIGDKLGEWTAIVHNKIVDAWSNVKNWVGDMWTIIKDSFSSLGEMLSGIWDSLKTIFSDSWTSVTEWLSTLWEDLKSAFSSTWETLKGFGDWIYTTLKDSFSGLADVGKDFINSLIDGLNNVLGYISEGLGYIGLDFSSRIPKIKDGVISPAGKIVSVDPKDYLLASKNPRDLMGGGNSGNNITINLTVNGNADRKMIDEITKKLRAAMSSKGAF